MAPNPISQRLPFGIVLGIPMLSPGVEHVTARLFGQRVG